MKAISLDDIGSVAQSATVNKTKPKKATVKAKTTAKKAKVVSAAPKPKLKKKKLITEEFLAVKKKVKIKTKKKAEEDSEALIKKAAKKKKLKTTLPKKLDAVIAQGDAMAEQMNAIVESIPDIVKQENDQIEEYMLMFTNCREMARLAEEQYRSTKNSREIYPLMQIYNQMRDIIADLRALRDVGKLGDVLNDEVLSPFAQSAASTLINVQQKMASYYKSNLNEKDIAESTRALNRYIREAAEEMTKSYHASLDKAVQVFSS